MAPNNEQSSAFLMIPAELRNKIYGYCLNGRCESPRGVFIDREDIVKQDIETKPPGILRCCKQVHQEAIQMYYFRTTFMTSSEDTSLNIWLVRIKPVYATLIQHVRVLQSLKYWQNQSHPQAGRESTLAQKEFEARRTLVYYTALVHRIASHAEVEINLWHKHNVEAIHAAAPTILVGSQVYNYGGTEDYRAMVLRLRPWEV
ncbi:hypothetical protein Slin15195_G105320 [Septoria linicola]|uniref:Uncharacterized protein n=1 Tax=Septoria linicola TaxID=215465 RepID=A0A9Q9EQ64_9PEZI|nr:hypothetical protein Slin14017_G068340 [Septoria linicola]USW57213.1 hypothetical protein Slin15195_G105320 [Septoria linicola]